MSTTFTGTEVNNSFSIYHTSWITSGPKSYFICDNIPTKAILFFFGCWEVNSTWLITSEQANQRALKVLFTCVVCTNMRYSVSRSGNLKEVDQLLWVSGRMAEVFYHCQSSCGSMRRQPSGSADYFDKNGKIYDEFTDVNLFIWLLSILCDSSLRCAPKMIQIIQL